MCEGRGQHTEAGWELCRSHGPLQGSSFRLQAGGGFVEAPGPQLVAPEWAAVCPEGPKAAPGEPDPGSGLGPELGLIQTPGPRGPGRDCLGIHFQVKLYILYIFLTKTVHLELLISLFVISV